MASRKGTRAAPLYTKITKGTKIIRCPKCKGQVMVDGTGWRQLPVGFGFRGDKFVVDAVRYHGYDCECPKHGRVFAWHTKKLITKEPKGIAKKLKAARGT